MGLSFDEKLQQSMDQWGEARDLYVQQNVLNEQARNQMLQSAGEKEQELEQKKTDVQQQVDDFVAGARSGYPFYRLLPNQRLLNLTDSGLIEGWSSHSVSSVEVIETVYSGTNPDTRGQDAQELIQAMRDGNYQHVSHSFNILKLVLEKSASETRPYANAPGIHFPLTSDMTSAAWVKLLSGDIRNGWANGADAHMGEWALCGSNHNQGRGGSYTGNHPIFYGDSTELLLALPSTVAGRFDLSLDSWGVFPFVHGETGVGD